MNSPSVIATPCITELPAVLLSFVTYELFPNDTATNSILLGSFTLGTDTFGANGSLTTLGSNDGNPAIVTFFLIFGFTFDIDFGVIDALIGISAFGS